MTALFREVLIESAEQAEALPADAILISADTALVPIEAEETREQVGSKHRSLYATPWEEA